MRNLNTSDTMFLQPLAFSATTYLAVKGLDYLSTMPPEGSRDGQLNQFRVKLAEIRSKCGLSWYLAAMTLDNLWISAFLIALSKQNPKPIDNAMGVYILLAVHTGAVFGLARTCLSGKVAGLSERVAWLMRPNFFQNFITA